MNTGHPPLTDKQLEKLACLEISHTPSAVICIRADDGRSYLFATAHYVDGIHEANPVAKTGEPPERVDLRFTSGEVVILGSGLDKIGDSLADGRLLGIKTVEPRYAAALKRNPIILSITVTRKEET